MSNLENETIGEPPTTSDRFRHILSAIDTIELTLHECSLEDLANNRMHRLALERLMEIIGVASDHIPDDVKITEPQIDWRTLSDMSARLENTRDRVEPDILWKLANDTLIPLKACAISRTANSF